MIPCLLPVITMADGFALAASCSTGRKVLMPLITPKRLVSRVLRRLGQLWPCDTSAERGNMQS